MKTLSLKTRPVGAPGLQRRAGSTVSCRPGALTRRGVGAFKHALSHWPRLRGFFLAGLALGWLGTTALAQPFLSAEYRVDDGLPVAMSLVSSNGQPQFREGEFTASVSTANLTIGPHYYEVRMQGTNGTWSNWQGKWFRVAGETHLTAAEWFVDTDPGYGLGTPIPLPTDGAWDEPEEDFMVSGVTVTNLTEGRHQLIIRAKDSNGDWGIPSQTTFYVAPPVTLVAAAWTTNLNDWGDPGLTPPATNQMRAADGTFDEDAEDLVATVNTLALGTNYCLDRTLYVRCQDSLGRWSTRAGLWWDAGAGTWRFDPQAGWGNNQAALVIAPQVASAAVPGNGNLAVTANNSVVLDWNDCLGVSGYALYFRASPTNPVTLLASGFTNSTLTLSSLPVAGRGEWWVRSLGDAGCGQDGPRWSFGFAQPRADDTDHDGIPDAWERYYFGGLPAINGATDRDGDGAKDWQEWAAGTVPTNRLDYFKLSRASLGAVNPWLGVPTQVLDWNSATGRTYTLYYTTELQDPVTVWTLFDQVPGTGGTISYTNAWPDPVGFYFLDVSVPVGP